MMLLSIVHTLVKCHETFTVHFRITVKNVMFNPLLIDTCIIQTLRTAPNGVLLNHQPSLQGARLLNDRWCGYIFYSAAKSQNQAFEEIFIKTARFLDGCLNPRSLPHVITFRFRNKITALVGISQGAFGKQGDMSPIHHLDRAWGGNLPTGELGRGS